MTIYDYIHLHAGSRKSLYVLKLNDNGRNIFSCVFSQSRWLPADLCLFCTTLSTKQT